MQATLQHVLEPSVHAGEHNRTSSRLIVHDPSPFRLTAFDTFDDETSPMAAYSYPRGGSFR